MDLVITMPSLDAKTWIDIFTLIAAVASASLFLYYVIMTKRQLLNAEKSSRALLEESNRTNLLQALTFIFRDLSSPQSRENRRYILLDLKDRSWKKLDTPKKRKLIEVWGSFDQIAYLIARDLLPKEYVTDMWGNAIKTIYQKSKKQLEEVKEERIKELVKKNGEDIFSEQEAREYMKYFTELAKEITQSSDKGK